MGLRVLPRWDGGLQQSARRRPSPRVLINQSGLLTSSNSFFAPPRHLDNTGWKGFGSSHTEAKPLSFLSKIRDFLSHVQNIYSIFSLWDFYPPENFSSVCVWIYFVIIIVGIRGIHHARDPFLGVFTGNMAQNQHVEANRHAIEEKQRAVGIKVRILSKRNRWISSNQFWWKRCLLKQRWYLMFFITLETVLFPPIICSVCGVCSACLFFAMMSIAGLYDISPHRENDGHC